MAAFLQRQRCTVTRLQTQSLLTCVHHSTIQQSHNPTGKGTVTHHDPPLLFDLQLDPAEEHALDTTQEPYKTALASVVAALAAQMHSVNNTMQSVVNYTTTLSAEPVKSIYCFPSRICSRTLMGVGASHQCSLGPAACYLLFMLTCALY